jgi:hypothetical protein
LLALIKMIDRKKPVKLTVGAPLLDRGGKKWEPGIFQPGELPEYFLTEDYCQNVEPESEPEPLREEPIAPTPQPTPVGEETLEEEPSRTAVMEM